MERKEKNRRREKKRADGRERKRTKERKEKNRRRERKKTDVRERKRPAGENGRRIWMETSLFHKCSRNVNLEEGRDKKIKKKKKII